VFQLEILVTRQRHVRLDRLRNRDGLGSWGSGLEGLRERMKIQLVSTTSEYKPKEPDVRFDATLQLVD